MQKCSGLEMQTETSWFHKYSKRRKVLILEFHKKLLKVICEKAKSIRKSLFADR